MIRRYLMSLVLGLSIASTAHAPAAPAIKQSPEEYVRDRVFLLHGPKGKCSAVQVFAPSGQAYMLSAAHCADIMDEGRILAENEQGKDRWTVMISVDYVHDIMLLSSVSSKALRVAKKEEKHQKIYTMTHGDGAPTYRTDGEILKREDRQFNLGPITTPDTLLNCLARNAEMVSVIGLDTMLCVQTVDSVITTAKLLPGGSGGALLNLNHELIGIASSIDRRTDFSGMVPLKWINHILRNK